MVNLFLIEDSGCSHCSFRRLCHSISSKIQLYCHTGHGDVIDFITRKGHYQFLPKPDIFAINYNLSSIHHAALIATIRSMPDIANSQILLCSSTLPDPDLTNSSNRRQAIKKLGDIDEFCQTPLRAAELQKLLRPHLSHTIQ